MDRLHGRQQPRETGADFVPGKSWTSESTIRQGGGFATAVQGLGRSQPQPRGFHLLLAALEPGDAWPNACRCVPSPLLSMLETGHAASNHPAMFWKRKSELHFGGPCNPSLQLQAVL